MFKKSIPPIPSMPSSQEIRSTAVSNLISSFDEVFQDLSSDLRDMDTLFPKDQFKIEKLEDQISFYKQCIKELIAKL